MGDCEDLCITGDNIKMRDINFTLQKHLGSSKEHASPVGGERDTLSNNSIEDNISKDLQGVGLVNFTETSAVESELDSVRRRKRKQENINIHRVSSKIAHSKQTVLIQDKVGEAKEGLLEAVEVEQGTLKVYDAAMGLLQVCDSSQDRKRCKMKIEASPILEVGFDMSTVPACAPNDKLSLDFDNKVSSATGKDREGTDAVNNVREKGFTSICDEALGTTIQASVVSRKELGSFTSLVFKNSGEIVSAAPTHAQRSCGLVDKFETSLHNDYENRGKVVADVKELSAMDQTECQKLRAALTALQSHFNALSSLAEKGSRSGVFWSDPVASSSTAWLGSGVD